jgi:predicted nucleic acid-binding protein
LGDKSTDEGRHVTSHVTHTARETPITEHVPPPRVVLDANVLYSETLTAAFVTLAAANLVTVCWSDRLREEWTMALARNRPDIDRIVLDRRIAHLEAAPHWSFLTIDPALVDTLTLPDHNDCHVLAAAIQSDAQHIVTANMRDFPKRTLELYGVSALTADALVCRLVDHAASATATALLAHTEDLSQHLERLRRAGLARAVKRLRLTAA